MTDLATLGIRVNSSDLPKAVNEMNRMGRAATQAERDVKELGQSAERTNKSVGGMGAGLSSMTASLGFMKGALIGVGSALAAAFSGRAMLDAAQRFTDIQNSLRTANLEGERLKSVYQELYAIGQRQGVGVGGLANLYGGIAQVSRELNATDEDMTRFTSGVATALRVQGSSAEQSAGALLQLRQALGSATIQAEEFNSMLDGARPVLQAVAAGLRESGGSVSRLRDLVREGKVSNQAFFQAFLAGQPIIENMANNALPTMGHGLQRVGTAFTDLTGKVDSALGVTSRLGAWFTRFASLIDNTIAPAILKLAAALGSLGSSSPRPASIVADVIGNIDEQIASAEARLANMPASRFDVDTMGAERGLLQQQLASLRQQRAGMASRELTEVVTPSGRTDTRNGRSGWSGRGRSSMATVSLDDFPTTGGGGGGGGGGTGSGGAATEAASIADEIKAIERRTEALRNEGNVIGLSTYATERNRVEFELRQAALAKNVEITPELENQIRRVSHDLAEQTATIEDQKNAWRGIQDGIRFAGQSFTSFASDLISGGKNASEALMNLLKRLSDVSLQAFLLGDGPLARVFGTQSNVSGGVGGLFGALGSLFGGARAAGGPIASDKFYMVGEKGPEIFAPGVSGSVIPNNALRTNDNGRAAPEVNINITTPPGTTARTQKREDGNGGFSIEVFIEQVEGAIAGNVGSGRGALAPALEGAYGLSRRGA